MWKSAICLTSSVRMFVNSLTIALAFEMEDCTDIGFEEISFGTSFWVSLGSFVDCVVDVVVSVPTPSLHRKSL